MKWPMCLTKRQVPQSVGSGTRERGGGRERERDCVCVSESESESESEREINSQAFREGLRIVCQVAFGT